MPATSQRGSLRPGGTIARRRLRAAPASVAGTADRALRRLWRELQAHQEAARRGDDPDGLHDFRVTARRLRAAFRFFAPCLEGTTAEACGEALADLRRVFSGARDSEVWAAFLEQEARRRNRRDNAAFQTAARRQLAAARRSRAGLTAGWPAAPIRAAFRRIDRLLTREWPVAATAWRYAPFAAFAAGRLRPLYRRILKAGADVERMTPEELHRLRRRCRKERYYAELAADALGPAIGELVTTLRRITTTLGSLHDLDVRRARWRQPRRRAPACVRKVVEECRRTQWRRFLMAWKALHRRQRRRAVESALQNADKET